MRSWLKNFYRNWNWELGIEAVRSRRAWSSYIELEALRAIIRTVFSLCTPLAVSEVAAFVRDAGRWDSVGRLRYQPGRTLDSQALMIAAEHVRFTIETEARPDFVLHGRDNLDIGSLVEVEEAT